MTKQLSTLLLTGFAACTLIASSAVAQPAPGKTLLNASGNSATMTETTTIEPAKVVEQAPKKTVKKAKKKAKAAKAKADKANVNTETKTTTTTETAPAIESK